MSAETRKKLQASPEARDAAQLAEMVETLTGISTELLQSYDRLEERAERVEKELCIANSELEKKVAEVEAILETLPVGVVVRDASDQVVRINDALAQMLGAGAEKLLLRDDAGCLPRHRPDGTPVEVQRGDGSRRLLASSASQILSDTGTVTGSIEVFNDRTELADLTDRVHQMDKMAALGNMAAGIAHEIRNPMNAVKGFADLFLRNLEPGTKDYRWAGLISEGVSEIDAIITSLLSFSQPEKLSMEELDTTSLLESAVAASLQRTPNDLDANNWDIQLESSGELLRGDRIKLRQALRNLISNALDVQPEGGAIHISAKSAGEAIRFLVSDAGPGVDPEITGRLTDPFFTTRAEGTGLGLSLVHTIVRLHGGELVILPSPSPLGGAQFSIQVPKAPLR